MKLNIATGQFPVSANIRKNLAYILRQIHFAKDRGALQPRKPLLRFYYPGVRCGALICHEYRYPELYREYKRRGVQLMFHSFHACNMPPRRWKEMREYVGANLGSINPGTTIPGITMPAAMHTAAANNYMWISCSNSSARESCWPAFFVRPDGVMTGRLRRNRAGVLISTVDTAEQWYDSTAAWRDRAMEGVFHSGTLVTDERSTNRTKL